MENDHLDDPDVNNINNVNNIYMDLQEVRCGAWTGSRWRRIGTGGGHL